MAPTLTKAEQTARTRRAILDQARSLFSKQGYAATGTEAIISELSITRGALYHHFKGKRDVFKAVYAEAYNEIIDYVNTRIEPIEGTRGKLVAGCQAFLEIARHEDLRRLVFVEAPAVLAAETLAEFDQRGFNLLYGGIQLAVDEGLLDTTSPEGFAHLVNGSINELGMWVAQSNDPQCLRTAQELVETLFNQHMS